MIILNRKRSESSLQFARASESKSRNTLPMFGGEELRQFVEQATWIAVNDYEGKLLMERTGWEEAAISERVRLLAAALRRELAGIDGVTLADQGSEQCAIVTFSAAQMPVGQLQQQLARRQINTSTVPFSANPVSSEMLHHPPLLRASLHYYNTLAEVERFVAELKQLL